MNFVNLSNARGVYRIKEVGLRKGIGAGRWQLIRQFLSESIVITFLAAICAIFLTNILLPFFNQFAGTSLRLEDSLHPHVFFSVLGFDKEHKYVLHLRSNAQIRKQVKTIKTEFLRFPSVLGAAASSSVPGRPMRAGYLKWSDDKLDKPIQLTFLSCDEDFLPQYKIDMVAGRSFDEKLNDENQAFIINEAAVPHLGYISLEEALGDRLHESVYGRWKTIVGVVKNFHYQGKWSELFPSVPLALLTLTRWLQDFAFRIQPDWSVFAMAGAAALLCAVVPILLQALWAARADPVESLRYE